MFHHTKYGSSLCVSDDSLRHLTSGQLEVGGGWGYTHRRFQLEALAGAGLGRTKAKQCDWTHPWSTEYPESCYFDAPSDRVLRVPTLEPERCLRHV